MCCQKTERSSITFEVVGTMESVCCDLPAACDVTKTGYGFLKYRVVIADIDEFVTLLEADHLRPPPIKIPLNCSTLTLLRTLLF